MIIDLLCNMRPIFPEELGDFDELRADLNVDGAFVGIMPAVSFDLWPIYALGCTHVSRFTGSNALPKIYIMPVAVSDCAIYPSLCETIREYYTGIDEFGDSTPRKEKGFFARLFGAKEEERPEDSADRLYGIRIDEMILLDSPAVGGGAPLRLSRNCECNTVYFRLSLPNGSTAHLFAVCTTPEGAWTDIIEKFDIRTEMIIHSHKGFGHWFTSTPLYSLLTRTRKPHLLPRFYFRGKFITTNDSPPASEEAEVFEDDIRGGTSIIYRLPAKIQ